MSAMPPGATISESIDKARGLGWFRAGAIALLVFGAVHSLAVIDALKGPPAEPKALAVYEAAHVYTADIGPFHASAWGGIQILNTSYSIMLLHIGILNLVLARAMVAAGLLRHATILNIVLTLALFGVSLAYQFPPPMVFALLCAAFFVMSLIRQR